MKVNSVFFKALYIGIIFFSSEFNFFLNNVKSFENIQTEIENYDKSNLDKSFYLIDSGDVLSIEFVNFTIDIKGIREYSNFYKVNSNGSIYLPEIGDLIVRGFTLIELEKLLIEKYKEYMYEQKINVSINTYRNITFYLGGEVNKPGLYVIESDNAINKETTEGQFKVRLFEALKKGQGLTMNADLSNIQIVRKNSNTNGGGKISTTINLLSLLRDGDQSVNIRIFDGDYIKVKKSEKLIKEQISLINKSNLTPDTIDAYIIGNVARPGLTNVKSGSNLYEAIASAGGASSQIGKIELIRFGENGKPYKKVITHRPNSYVSSKNNPEIQNGDIITIRRNLLGKTTAALQEISSPILSSFGLYNLFN